MCRIYRINVDPCNFLTYVLRKDPVSVRDALPCLFSRFDLTLEDAC